MPRIPLLPTTVVGSYPQPDWLVNRAMVQKNIPRVRAPDLWRVAEPYLQDAQDDATILAIQEMEKAGIDIITDGEIRRESYSNRFALELEGVDADRPAEVPSRTPGTKTMVPRVVGPIRRSHAGRGARRPVPARHTARATKITLPGPFTLAQQAKNEFYKDEEEMAMDYAVAVNEELRAIKATGIDVVQLDEPWLQARPEQAGRYGIRAINRALEGIEGATAIHLCFGYAHVVSNKPAGYTFLPQLADCTVGQISIESAQPKLDLGVLRDLAHKKIILGVIDLGTHHIETADEVAARVSNAPQIRRRRPFDPRPRLRHEIHPPQRRLREAEGAGGRDGDGAGEAGVGGGVNGRRLNRNR